MTPSARPATLLTPVDLRLLDGLLAHRVLTTAQAAQVAGVQLRMANYRLGRLRDARLVDRERPYAPSGTAPHHWWLTTAGRTRRGAPGRARSRSRSPQFLVHTAATAAVPLALASRGPDVGLRLLTWRRDEDAWESWPTYEGTARITPDGYALVHVEAADVAVPLMVEVDLASMPLGRLREKAQRYLSYAAANAWHGRHSMCPPLLLLTTSEERALNILAVATRERERVFGYTSELLVAVTGRVDNADEAVIGPVWHCDHNDDGEAARARVRTLSDVLEYRVSTERDPDLLLPEGHPLRAATQPSCEISATLGFPRDDPRSPTTPARDATPQDVSSPLTPVRDDAKNSESTDRASSRAVSAPPETAR